MYFEHQLTIKASSEIKAVCPAFHGIAVYASVVNTFHNDALWEEIDKITKKLLLTNSMDDIKQQYAIAATREAYKSCGKDPSRYRPSAEALRRRLLRGLNLYEIDTLVDVVNLVSLQSGYSIGGFDADKIQGDNLVLGIGKADEPYEGIGRGVLNIERLPVYRDAVGGIGTPTSDNERTKMDLNTRHILAIINAYDGDAECTSTVELMSTLLTKYAEGKDIEIYRF